ncbi:MAG: TonB-dependent receptor [Pricia sp.]|nr:TonB-dependent receptor [Pricia sp.]
MKRNLVAGYNGALYNRYTQGILPKHTFGTDHYFKGKKTGLSVNYNFSHNREVVRYTDVTNFLNNNEITSTWTAEQEYIRKRKRHNLSAFFDYDIDKESRLSLSTITIWQPDVKRLYDTETAIIGDTVLSGFNTINDAQAKYLNTSYYLDYRRQLSEKGAEFSVNAHYTYYDYKNGQNLETEFFDIDNSFVGDNDFTTDSEQYINLYSLQSDYSAPIGESVTFESGLRYARTQSKSTIIQEGFDRDQPGIEPTEAGKFDYDESIYAAYASFNAKWDLWRLRSGLRAEYTETMGRWTFGDMNTENNYLKLFPSFSLQYTPNEIHDFNLYYYRRINRPRYESINPFQVFQSNFSTIEGDPNLLPATRHYLAGGYTFKSSYTVELFYRNEKNRLEELIFQNNDTRLLRFINSNISSAISYGLDFSISKDFTSFWNCYLLASFFDETYTFNNLGTDQTVENNLFSWFVKTSNSFTFLSDKSLTADLTFLYGGPQVSGNARFDGFGALGLLFRKTLWNKKASISMGMEDIFNQGNQFNTRNYLDQNGTSLRRAENRLFTLGFRYKFGNVKISDNQKSQQVEERDRL